MLRFNSRKIAAEQDEQESPFTSFEQEAKLLSTKDRRAQRAQHDKKVQIEKYHQEPFAIFIGDPSAHLRSYATTPSAFHYVDPTKCMDCGKARHMHTSELKADNLHQKHYETTGFEPTEEQAYETHPYMDGAELKKALLADNNYGIISLPRSQFAHDDEMASNNKTSLQAFFPRSLPIQSINKDLLQKYNELDYGKHLNRLRQQVPQAKGSAAPGFFDLAAAHGADTALRSIFTDQVPKMPVGPNLNPSDYCAGFNCGRTADKHVKPEDALAYYKKNGVAPEVHPFLEQHEADEYGRAFKRGVYPQRTGNQQAEASEQETKNIIAVTIGQKPTRIERYVTLEDPSVTGANRKNQEPTIPCTAHCFAGKKTSKTRDNVVPCRKCKKDHIINKIEGDELLPATKGLGNGKFINLIPSDLPDCPNGCNNGKKTVWNAYTKKEEIQDCPTCNVEGGVPGKDTRPQDCDVCEIPGVKGSSGYRQITNNNTCTTCHGTTRVANPKYNPNNPLTVPHETYMNSFIGNPYHELPIMTRHGIWKAHGNPNCQTCHGDDDFQTETNHPCSCRIPHPDDDTAFHGGNEFIHPETGRITLPNSVFQKYLDQAYDHEPPLSMRNISSTIDSQDDKFKNTKQLGVYFKFGSGSTLHERVKNIIGLYNRGLQLPPEAMQRLTAAKKEAQKSPNYKYAGASAELEAIHQELNDHLAEYPMVVQTTSQSTRPIVGGERLPKEYFHEKVRKGIPKVEKAVSSAAGGDISAYGKYLDRLYDSYSKLEKAKRRRSTTGSEDELAAAKASVMNRKKQLLSRVFKDNLSAHEISKAIDSSLPKVDQ